MEIEKDAASTTTTETLLTVPTITGRMVEIFKTPNQTKDFLKNLEI